MIIDNAKKYILSKINIKHKFISYSSRNQKECFYGYINRVYPNIFTIIRDNGYLLSFSYSDVIIGRLKII